jgi:hypothetical protein
LKFWWRCVQCDPLILSCLSARPHGVTTHNPNTGIFAVWHSVLP